MNAKNILVFNCGSSTLKFQLIEAAGDTGMQQRKLARGIVDRIGAEASCRFEGEGWNSKTSAVEAPNHQTAVGLVIDWLAARPQAVAIDAVGHRVVHGGNRFASAVLLDDAAIAEIDALSELAPLHNPGSVNGIRAARAVLPAWIPMAAAFDTSFHYTIPEVAATYAIPHQLSAKHGIRRYGFHGLAHQYDLLRYAELNAMDARELNLVTLHLGNGCSACAIRHGKSVDTSMGFTPLEGLVMGTRSGDIDPALVIFLAQKESVRAAEVERWLNKQSGLLGLSGYSNDMRELTAAYDHDAQARLAVEIFCYRARKYLAAYFAVLAGKVDAVVFSGGIGENSPLVRATICNEMAWCGIEIDRQRNNSVAKDDAEISTDSAKVKLHVIHADEESVIAGMIVTILTPN